MTETNGAEPRQPQPPTTGFIHVPEPGHTPATPEEAFGPLTADEREQFAFLRSALSGQVSTLTLQPMRVMHDGQPRVALVAVQDVGDELLATPLALLLDAALFEQIGGPAAVAPVLHMPVEKDDDVEPEVVETLLMLVDESFPATLPTLEEIVGWTQETREEVAHWATAVHLLASDNDVEVPPLPEVLR